MATKKNTTGAKTIVIIGTKGGTGKSTFSSIMTSLIDEKSSVINLFEIDNNNRSYYPNAKAVNFKTIKVKKTEEVIEDISFDIELGENITNIIDCGGGDDSKAVIKELAEITEQNKTNTIYFVPVNDDIEQFDNVKITIKRILEVDPSANIHIVLNKCESLTAEAVKNQFIAFYGDDEIGFEGRLEEIAKDVNGIHFVPSSKYLGVTKNFGMTMLDMKVQSLNIIDNIAELRAKWTEEGREVYKKNFKKYKLAKRIVDFLNNLESIKKVVNDEKSN